MSAKILLMTYGTRGDIEPLLALALGQKAAGLTATLATAGRFGEWVAGHGIGFAPISDAALDLIDSDEGRDHARRFGGALEAARGRAAAYGEGRTDDGGDVRRHSLAAARAFPPDMIVFHPKMLAAPHIAEHLRIPAVLVALQPMLLATSAFPAPGLPRLPLPGYNRLSGVVIENLDWVAFLDRYDRPGTLFYLDPPYWGRRMVARSSTAQPLRRWRSAWRG